MKGVQVKNKLAAEISVMRDRNFRVIAESARHIVRHTFEAATVVEKMSGREFDLGSHYGDPRVAVIAPDEGWFIAGGEGLTYFSEVPVYWSFFVMGRKGKTAS